MLVHLLYRFNEKRVSEVTRAQADKVRYAEEIADPDRYRPDNCPQCEATRPLAAHGFSSRTLLDVEFDGTIRVRRYLCRCCKRTVSLPLW